MSPVIDTLDGRAFLGFPELTGRLRSELMDRLSVTVPCQPAWGEDDLPFVPGRAQWFGDLVYCPTVGETLPYWARTTMLEPFLVHFDSVGDATKVLMSLQRNWAPYPCRLFRRMELVRAKLPFLNLKTRPFPYDMPCAPMGLYTLTDEHTMLASARTSSALPAGCITFEEDRVNPPSRAYRKLQEGLIQAHALFGVPFPHAGQRCFDAGACPGGWTWVLRSLGAEVFAVDRSELAPALMRDPQVTFCAHDAFTLKPAELGAFDWVVSDVICYPERLLTWIQEWLASGLTQNMVCTIKLQGAFDWSVIAAFAAIPNSHVMHLNYNKHELTFIHATPPEAISDGSCADQ